MMLATIDIGSTWTKGALFRLVRNELSLEKRADYPTTTHDLSDGFFHVLKQLTGTNDPVSKITNNELALSYSSSAKGGLSVAALGLVPNLTLQAAKMAACSAGAKLGKVFSYRLNSTDISSLEAAPPDILLFTGGTDGGDRSYALHNAAMLARSEIACTIIYAGNRCIRDEISGLLKDKDLLIVDNLLPQLDLLNPEPARFAMHEVFLSKIVEGKGLNRIVRQVGVPPSPTPYVMHEYVRHIRQFVPGWDDFILLDIGGATTDVYSAHREAPAPGVVVRGLREPDIKRTVECDLGMRISAIGTLESGAELAAPALRHQEHMAARLKAYVGRVTAAPAHLAQGAEEQHFEEILAGICVAQACARHAGRHKDIATREGMIKVQRGRDLSAVHRVIGSGGWLAKSGSFNPDFWMTSPHPDAETESILLPPFIEYYQDNQYLMPLLANAARHYPAAAARAGVRALVSKNQRVNFGT